MDSRKTWLGLMMASAALLSGIAACGGGGAAAPAPAPVDPNASLTAAANDFGVNPADFTGDAAGGDGGAGGAGGSAGDGAPIKRATVVMVDKNGLQKFGMTDDNGNYLVNTRTAMKAPIVLKVIEASGKVLSSVINEDINPGVFKRVMINPLTDKIVSDSLSSSVSGTDKVFDGSKIDASKLDKAIADLRTSVQASLASVGVTATAAFNPIITKYAYDGKGVDAVIESISHQRDPATGQTQLAVKTASSTDANGVAQPVLITAAAPLPVANVITASSPELTYDKLNNFATELNYCWANSGSSDAAVKARCEDGSKPDAQRSFASSAYKQNGKDFLEDFRTVLSESDRSAVKGSTVRNTVILYTGKYLNASGVSTATFNDLAVVELTIRQPRTGPLADNVLAEPLEYSKIVVFKRDDGLTQAKAGNWIMHGNQSNYDWGIQIRTRRYTQLNPVAEAEGFYSSHTASSIRGAINPEKFDSATRQWLPSGLRAVRITGPGMPSAGVVFANKTYCGLATYMPILNTTGVVGNTVSLATTTGSDVYLGRVRADGSPLKFNSFTGNFPSSYGNSTSTYITDFSNLRAFNLYKAEFFLSSNTSGVADAVEYRYSLAAVPTPQAIWGLPFNDASPLANLVQPGSSGTAPGGTSFNFSWINNPLAQEVSSVGIYAEQGDPVGGVATVNGNRYWNYFPKYGVPNARVLSARPTSYTLNMANSGVSDCQYGDMPSLKAGVQRDYREASISSSLSRMTVQNILRWDNPFHTTTMAFPAAVAPAANTLQAYQASSTAAPSTVSLAMTLNLGTFTGVITSPTGATSTGTGVFIRRGTNANPATIQIAASTPMNVTTVNSTGWNDSAQLYTGVTLTPANINTVSGTLIPLGLTLRDANGNYWSGILKGKTFTGTYSVPLTGSTAGIPGSWNRFSVDVTMNLY